MKRAEPDSNRSSNSLPSLNGNGHSANSTHAGQNGGVQGDVRVTALIIKTEPGEEAPSGLPLFPPPPPPVAPAGRYPGIPHPMPHFTSAASAIGPGWFALQPHWPPQAPPPGMPMLMPPMAPPPMSTAAPNNFTPAGWRGSSTPAPVDRNLAPPPAPSGAAVPAGAEIDVFLDKVLRDSVKSAMTDWDGWWATYSNLQGKERERYGMATLLEISGSSGQLRFKWKGRVKRMLRDIGTEAFLVDSSKAKFLVYVLTLLHFNELLSEVLKSEAVKRSLLDVTATPWFPLRRALEASNYDAARMILNCDDEHGTLRMQPSFNGHVPLHAAVAMANLDMVDLLLRCRGREQRLASGASGFPLHLAIGAGASVAIVRKLLEDCAVEQVLCQNTKGSHPLRIAVMLRDIEAVKVLLAVKPALAQQLALRNAAGRSAYDVAKKTGDAEIIALLEEAMKELPSSSASSAGTGISSASTSSSSTGNAAQQEPAEKPVPLTPYPQTPMPEPDDFDLAGYGADLF